VTGELDPLIHVPTRLRIVATLAVLPDGDALSFTRLQEMLGLTPGNLIIQLRKLEDAGYISSTKTRVGSAQKTTVALTGQGRAALRAYTQALRDLLGGLDTDATTPHNTADDISADDAEPKAAARDRDQAGITLTLDADPADRSGPEAGASRDAGDRT